MLPAKIVHEYKADKAWLEYINWCLVPLFREKLVFEDPYWYSTVHNMIKPTYSRHQ